MEQADILAFPRRRYPLGRETEYLEDTSLRRIVLEHYDHEHVAIRRYLSFLGVDADTGQEIVQESFLKLHEHLLAGGDRTNLRAWLYRVAHNLARNAQTAFRTSKTDSLPDVVVAGDLPAQVASAEEELLEAERTGRVRDAMNQLSAAQRECLVLRAQGLKYREIADILNVSVSTVAENVQRGLKRLKDLL